MATMFATRNASIGGGLGSTDRGVVVNVEAFLKPARKRLGTVDAGEYSLNSFNLFFGSLVASCWFLGYPGSLNYFD